MIGIMSGISNTCQCLGKDIAEKEVVKKDIIDKNYFRNKLEELNVLNIKILANLQLILEDDTIGSELVLDDEFEEIEDNSQDMKRIIRDLLIKLQE